MAIKERGGTRDAADEMFTSTVVVCDITSVGVGVWKYDEKTVVDAGRLEG